MGTAQGLLKSSGGEQANMDGLSRWRRYISRRIDTLFGGGGSSGTGLVDFAEKTYRQDGDMVVATGNTNNAFQLQPLVVTTTQANEKVEMTFTADRVNASATGAGRYQFTIDGVAVGRLKELVGNVRDTISMSDIFTIATPGTHTLSVNVTAVGGNETMFDFAILTGVGYTGV